MRHPLPFSTAIMLCLAIPALAVGQCTDQVTHASGTQLVGDINVAVSSTGIVDVNDTYCTQTFPFFAGYEYAGGTSGTGSYTFSFVPSITGATFNVSGLSEVPGSDLEHVRLYINGAHYAVPVPGVLLSCDELGVLTPDGDIGPCPSCSVSGMGQIMLPGPISSLTVEDTVFLGQPAGALFSLFICGAANGIATHGTAADRLPFPNPATTTISLPRFAGPGTTATLLDTQGRVVRTFEQAGGDRSPLNVADLPRGAYVLVLHNTTTTYHKVVLE